MLTTIISIENNQKKFYHKGIREGKGVVLYGYDITLVWQ